MGMIDMSQTMFIIKIYRSFYLCIKKYQQRLAAIMKIDLHFESNNILRLQ